MWLTGTLVPRWNLNKPVTVFEDRATLSQRPEARNVHAIAYQNLLNFVIGLNSNKQATVFEDRATLSQLEFALGHFTATVSFVTGSDCEKRFEC